MEFIQQYRGLNKLGQGAFGKVYLAAHEDTKEKVVIKVIDWSSMNADQKAKCLKEVGILQKLEHGNIVKYLYHFETRPGVDIGATLGFAGSGDLSRERSFISGSDSNTDGASKYSATSSDESMLCVVMEYAPLGDLDQFLDGVRKRMKEGGAPLAEETIWKLLIQIIIAVGTLHHHHILHRDIKPANILVSADGETIVADLGIASDNMERGANHAQTCIGTPYYQSPEMWKGKVYGGKCDVWAIGCMLFEMMALTKPFIPNPPNNVMGLVMKVVNEEHTPFPDFAKEAYTQELRDLVAWMLMKSPKERPTTLEVWTYACKCVSPEKILGSVDAIDHPWTGEDLGKSLSSLISAKEGENKAAHFKGNAVVKIGKYSNVYEVENVTSKQPYIMKEIFWSDLSKDAKTLVKLEIEALARQNHPYILNHRAFFKTKENVGKTLGFEHDSKSGHEFKSLCAVMPVAAKGDLAAIVKKNKEEKTGFAETDLWRYLQQLVAAVGHMQKNGMHPSDVRPSNILLTEENNIMIGDFCVSRMMIDTATKDEAISIGKYDFYSPEKLGGVIDDKSDAWAIGCTMYELANQRRAFHRDTEKELIDMVSNGYPYPFSVKTTPVSPELRTCIKWMLQKDPAKRPTLQNLYSYIYQIDEKIKGDYQLDSNLHKFKDNMILKPMPLEKLLVWVDVNPSPPKKDAPADKVPIPPVRASQVAQNVH